MNMEFTNIYKLARDFALQTNRNIFLTGKAGTGKTTFLHQLKDQTDKQMAIVAPTGVAAINAGGVTMHSFFQLPFTPFIPTAEGKKDLIGKIKMRAFKRRLIRELELLVIDEISMVRADTLDAVDTVLRNVRYRHKEPFGGVQVIFIGDMFQLSPVAADNEWSLLSPYYRSPYFFDSLVALQSPPVYIELDKIFRQSNESFIRILNEVRNNCLSQDSLKQLMIQYNPLFVPDDEDGFITLTTHNYKADLINSTELNKLSGETRKYKAKTEGDFPDKSYPTDFDLELKIGAKVMLIKNDTVTPRRFYNGKIGIIESFEDEFISIKCPDDEKNLEIYPMEWDNIRYRTNTSTLQIEEDLIGKFIQYPLRLAWAITIHKSQGLTFDKAVIDAGDAFAPGQVYVALSRCRSLEGIILRSKIDPLSMMNDQQIIEHEKQKVSTERLTSELEESRKLFRLQILKLMFDYGTLSSHTGRFLKSILENEGSFNKDTIPYIQNIQKQFNQISEIALKFQNQLESIFAGYTINEEFLQERLEAAKVFFIENNKKIIETLIQSPANTDNKELAKDYNDGIKELHAPVVLKNYLLQNIRHPFDSEQYFNLKNKFTVPEIHVNAYSKVSSGKTFKVNHPTLYFRLLELRNRICEPDDTPIYLVASGKTLQEMADFLPLSEKDLLEIHGFGKTKVDKYGKLFLDLITDYCFENNLTSMMYEKSIDEKGKKKRKSTKK